MGRCPCPFALVGRRDIRAIRLPRPAHAIDATVMMRRELWLANPLASVHKEMMNTPLHVLELGRPYAEGVTSYPKVAQYNFRGGGHELAMFFGSPTEEEVRAIRIGRAEFALLVESGVVVLLYRFEGNSEWSDCPYSYHLVPREQQQLPFELPTPESRAMLLVLLVDAYTGLLHVIRECSLSPDFTRRLHEAIREQAAEGFSLDEHQHALAELYLKYPTSNAMADAAQAKCVGGD